MSRLIDAEDFERVVKEYCKHLIDHNKHTMDVVDFNADIQGLLDNQPTFDYEKMIGQYIWERDIAISQLEQLGIKFAEKLDDQVIKKVKEVMKCD